ncbi:tRNA-dihydrouridine synthase, partial [Piptocephalis cylindrospora]
MVKVTTPSFLHLMSLVSPKYVDLYTEMRHAQQILKEPTAQGLSRLFGPANRPGLVVQLGGSDPAMLGDATARLAEAGYGRVNLNCGCPSKNVQAGSFGAVLMKDADLVGRILKQMDVSSSGHHMQLSVKCRVGVDEHDSPAYLHHFLRTIITAVPHLESVTVHARKAWLSGVSPKDNRRIPELQHERVYGLKKALGPFIPPIWTNGGVGSVEEAMSHMQYVDGVMIGRKVQSSPMFMAECVKELYGVSPPSIAQVIQSY